MNRVLIAALVVSVVVLTFLGGYYLFVKYFPTRPTPSQPTSPQALKGFTKAQELANSNRSVLTHFRIQLSYVGKLTNFESGKSWTLEQSGKTYTITHESTGKISYLKSMGQGNPTQTISESNIKVGDRIYINTFIDPTSGTVSVNTITLIPGSP